MNMNSSQINYDSWNQTKTFYDLFEENLTKFRPECIHQDI